MTTYAYFDLDQLPHCCGAWEMGNLIVKHATSLVYREMAVSLDDPHFIEKIRDAAQGRPVFVNFVQLYDEDTGGFEDDYECAEIKAIIETAPHVVDLGTWINPGSDNRIHGFMIKGTVHE